MLKRVDEGLWCVDSVMALPGVGQNPVRMTVVRLADGGLWLYSPIEATDELVAAVQDLGPVRFVVAPCKIHHLFLGGWLERFPEAQLWGPPGLAWKRKDLDFDGELGPHAEPVWADDLDQCLVDGVPMFNEVVFLHRATGTLLCADLVFNLIDDYGLVLRTFSTITGTRGRFARSRVWGWVTQDRLARDQAIQRVLGWPVRRIVMSHGRIVEADAAAELKRVWSD